MFLVSLFAVVLSAPNPQTWIGDNLSILGPLSLKNITLPGTHDSGTYYLSDAQMPGDEPLIWEVLYYVANLRGDNVANEARYWAQSQDRTFYEQMKGGMRYFDLRCGWNESSREWVTYHFLQGSPIRECLQNISQYLVDYPKEIVIIEMSHFTGYLTNNEIVQLKNQVLDILGLYLFKADYTFGFSINDMVSSGKRAIVTMESMYDNITIWSPDVLYNTYANTPDLKEMVAYNNATIQKYMAGSHASQLFKISWTLTPNATTIEDSVLPWKPQDLLMLADQANKALPSFWNSIKKNGWKMGNLALIDHFESSILLNITWAMNGLTTIPQLEVA